MNIYIILVPLLVTLVGLLGTSLVQRNLKERERFTKAAYEFRQAFQNVISRLSAVKELQRIVLYQEFPGHREAALVFRHYLHRPYFVCSRQGQFDSAWKAYEEYHKERTDVGTCRFFATEISDPSRMSDPAHRREVAELLAREALAHINALLAFAEPR